MEALRGHTTGYAVPQFVIDAPGGGGKVPIAPDYVLAHDKQRVILRNYEGKVSNTPKCWARQRRLSPLVSAARRLSWRQIRTMQPASKRTTQHNVGLAYNWQYDTDFIQTLDRSLHHAGLSSYVVGPHNLAQTTLEVHNGERQFDWFLDRASDDDRHFLQLNQVLQAHGTHFLNAHGDYLRAIDKAEIHRDLVASGLQLPLTLILAPHEREPQIDIQLIQNFAKPFVVKPAKGGGGRGVLIGATKVEDVLTTRTKHRDQRYLIQQSVEPQLLGERRAWFRVYHVCGTTIVCWWDDRTHRYAILTPSDASRINVPELERIVRIVADVAQLDFFSTEIALDKHGRYVVIDYVNTPCDMRPQSKHFNGVPDTIIQQIVAAITGYLKLQITNPDSTPSDAALWP
jgi:glutathione synthase/RimK-type ligase-like ATP-grasp enzyme